MADSPLPAELVDLLDGLESHSPSLSALPPPEGSWGTFFLDEELGESSFRREVRLRIMAGIGNCRSLKTIDLNPSGKPGMYSVRDVEAKAMLNGLKRSNPELESLSLSCFKGFGTTEACKALAAAVVRPSGSLKELNMRGVGLGVEGLGHISAALRDNSSSVLRLLDLSDNEIGDAAGAQHIAAILAHLPALRSIGLCGIGMDDAGAVVIADAVARTTTLEALRIGYDREKDPEQAAMLVHLLSAMTPGKGAASSNQSLIMLFLELTGLPGGSKDCYSAVEAGLAEAVAGMLSSNTKLELLKVTSSLGGVQCRGRG